jgi:predicted RNase H-like nuclease
MVWICGVDGFKSQWCAVLRNLKSNEFRVRVLPFGSLPILPENPAIIGVDVPIGLPDVTPKGGRTCERLARGLVGYARASSVFSTVGRIPLAAGTRAEADRISRESGGIGVGAQSWGLAKKLLEVDNLMTPALQQVVREVHPEVSFREMAGCPVIFSKKTPEGEHERVAALVAAGFPEQIVTILPIALRVRRDDFLDACAALWTAERIHRRAAKRIPEIIERDPRGLDMAIWF